jgi:hypothetical protein
MSLLDGLAERRALIESVLLTATGYIVRRVLVNDGMGTDVETFVKDTGSAFKCRLQPYERRPDQGMVGDAIYESIDYLLVYPTNVTLIEVDRIMVNDETYSIRHPYDNVDDQMSRQAYLTKIQQERD